MKTLYLDCGMGAAGDMLSAALLELVPDREGFLKSLQALGIPGITVRAEQAEKCGIWGTHFSVLCHGEEEASFSNADGTHEAAMHDVSKKLDTSENAAHVHCNNDIHIHNEDSDVHEHHHHSNGADADAPEHHHHPHSSLRDITHFVSDHLALPDSVRRDILAVYGLLAEAESHAHGVPVQEIHFHEVGTMDAVADITAFCLLVHALAPDEIIASPVCTGSGQVHCAHGILPVPAPATAYLLRGIPSYSGTIREELCTPTGAALLKYFATKFGPMPVMTVHAIGYGMGKKEFPAANCVRAMIGDTPTDSHTSEETVTELYCQIDDMTAEEIGFASEILLSKGALDVFTLPIGMKKSRPGTLICVICRNEERDAMLGLIFRHTTTLGIRENKVRRHTLSRSSETIRTELGGVRKKSAYGFGTLRDKYEYEDVARIAREQDLTFREAIGILNAETEG